MCANFRQGTGQPEIREYPSDPGIQASRFRFEWKRGFRDLMGTHEFPAGQCLDGSSRTFILINSYSFPWRNFYVYLACSESPRGCDTYHFHTRQIYASLEAVSRR